MSHSTVLRHVSIDVPSGHGLYTYTAGTDVTGPSNATQAILSVYDIFGFFPQTIQGADILAHSDKEHQYQVYMPDFFEGEPADLAWYPPDTKEKGEKLGNFFKTKAGPPMHLPKVKEIVQAAEEQNSNIKGWGIMGYCWGGKIASLVAGQQTKFSAAVQVHPAMLDTGDAEKVQIPSTLTHPVQHLSEHDLYNMFRVLKDPSTMP